MRLVSVLVLAALFTAFPASAADPADAEHPMVTSQRAAADYAAGRFAEAAAGFTQVLKVLPKNISTRYALASALVKAGRLDDALRELDAAAAFGTRFDDSDAVWNAVRSDPRFLRIASLMKARSAPLVRSETAFLLEKDLIPESIAFDPVSGRFYAGSMYKAKILQIAPDGQVSDFIPSRRHGLWGVLGMKIDRGSLWANSCNIDSPPMQIPDSDTAGQAAIFRFELPSGKLIGKYDGPAGSKDKPFCFNDLVFAPNGDLYATSGGDGIYRLRKDQKTIEQLLPPDGSWLNGITISPDGSTIFVASHLDGVVRISLADLRRELVATPDSVTLGAIDGLYFHEGSLIGVQASDPPRVIRAWLDPSLARVTRFAILEQNHPLYDHPLTGVIRGMDLYYVARSQLRAFDKGTIWPMDRLKDTVILKLPLEPAGPRIDQRDR